ncbi:hypothetical protein VTL71DRAFT_13308 [Oculimacula yallundae]|uniref:Uncharacterized protein n=1 Tax=Oculimacula yallundae TaxID=86028 RepID=A0ABR4CJZ4_9HELO
MCLFFNYTHATTSTRPLHNAIFASLMQVILCTHPSIGFSDPHSKWKLESVSYIQTCNQTDRTFKPPLRYSIVATTQRCESYLVDSVQKAYR